MPIILLSAVLPRGAPEAYAFLHEPFEEVLGQWVAQTLQGPLDTARAQLKRLEAGPAVDRVALESLEAQLQSMETLGRHLKDVARLAVGGLALQPVEADLTRHLRDAVTAWRAHAPVTLVAPSEPVSLRIDTDPGQGSTFSLLLPRGG